MKKTIPNKLLIKHITTLLSIMGVIFTSAGQCPTVVSPSQTFCDVESPVIANLSATNNGGGVVWYESPTSTTPLTSAIGLVSGEDYYADDASGTCGTRQRVDVTIYRAPNALSFQGVCVDDFNEATISDLLAIGNDIQWYTVSTGGTALPPTTVLTDDTLYYVDQSNPNTGCRSSRRSVFVQVGVVPVPTGKAIQVFCSDTQNTVADLTASGTNRWYPTISSANPLDPSTPLVDGQSYFATTLDLPCESTERLEVKVEFKEPNDSGRNGEIEICETGVTGTGSINLFDALLGTPDTTGMWSGPLPTINGNAGTVDVSTLTAANSPYVFAYEVSSDACPSSTSTVTIFITEGANPGTNGTLTLCSTDAGQDLFDSLEGTPEPGGTWSPALSSGSGIFDPSKDNAGTYTYTVQGVPPCGEATATVTVTVNPEAQPGTNGTLTLCENSTPTDLFNSLGGTPEFGGTWTPALLSGTGVFDPSKDLAGTYTYNVSGISPCGIATATVTVTIQPLPNVGTDGTLILCSNDAPKNLFESLGGTPESGGTWSPALSSGTGVFDPSKDTSGIYTYTISGAAPCGDATARVRVTINPEAQPGSNGALVVCEGSDPKDLFNSLGGTPQSGGVWSPALASGTGVFDPTQDIPGIYTYTVSGTTPCGDASAEVNVTIATVPQAGSGGRLAICRNEAPQDLFDSLGGTPEAGGTWSPALASGTGVFNPAQDNGGSYTYTVTTDCGTDSARVIVTIIPPPNSSGLTLSANSICLDELATINLSGATQLANGTYNLNYSLSGANNSEQTIAATITNGSTTITVPASQLTTAGTTTFTILNLINPVTNCGTASNTPPTVQISVEDARTPQLLTGGDSFCEDDAPTLANLTSNLVGGYIITWFDAPENGTAYVGDTLLVDGTTYYASNSTVNGCGNGIRLAVTVNVKLCEPLKIIIPDGFSPNGDNINDNFEIKNLRKLYPDFKLQIYNRYGNVLYKGDNTTNDWNGTSNQGREIGNGILPVGVYYYILEFHDGDTKTIQGSVYLNR